MIKFHCEHCGRKLGVPVSFAGRRVRCTECSEPVTVPRPDQPVAVGRGMTDAADPQAGGSRSRHPQMLDALSSLAPPASVAHEVVAAPRQTRKPPTPMPDVGATCPQCGVTCNPGAALCVQCGHSFKHGRSIATMPHPPMDRFDAPGMNDAVARATGAVVSSGLGMLIAGGLAAGVCGAAWAGITIATGYEIGWVAWGLGLVVGVAVAAASRHGGGTGPGFAAVAFAIAGLIVAKLLIFQWGVPSMGVRELVDDHQFVTASVVYRMIDRGDLGQELHDAYHTGGLGIDVDTYDHVLDDTQRGLVQQRVNNLSPDARRDMVRGYLLAIMEQVPFTERITMSMSYFDLLWAFLALGTAFKVGSGGGSGE